MTYAILNLVLSWATKNIETANIETANQQLRRTGEAKVSQDYLEAQAELALALKKVMKFN
jgi:hypothetical protein